MPSTSKYTVGFTYGIITALMYIVLLFLHYHFFDVSPVFFGLSAIVSYIIILIMYFLTGIARKKQLHGLADMREIFQSIFIVILMAEFVYVVFNFIYLKYVDPNFWEKLKAITLAFNQKRGWTKEQIEQSMKSFKDANVMMEPMGLVKGYGFSVIIDSIFGFLFASILRKRKPAFEEILVEPK